MAESQERGESTLSVYVDGTLREHARVAYAALERLCELAGWRCRSAESYQESDLAYGASIAPTDIPCAGAAAWGRLGRQDPVRHGNLLLPQDSVLRDAGPDVLDPVLAGHFFLSGWHERQAGVDRINGIPGRDLARWGAGETPVVQVLAELLPRYLRRGAAQPPPRATRWPKGKSWALCLTHDCDRVFRYRPWGHIRDLGCAGMSWRKVAGSLAKSAASLAGAITKPDPYLQSWTSWFDLERKVGLPSALYVATRTRYEGERDLRDVAYRFDHPRIRKVLRSWVAEGWEVGLHSSVHAWEDAEAFRAEVTACSEACGSAVTGFRGHHWSLRPDNPEQTLAMAAGLGLTYDTSLGMNLLAGFRRGSGYPFRPYLRDTGADTGLWELPPTVMDGSLLSASPTPAGQTDALRAMIRVVRDHAAALVLDWHTDSLWPGFPVHLGAALRQELETAAGDATCWVATPRQVIRWCAHDRWQASP